MLSADDRPPNEVGVFEDTDVLGDRGKGNRMGRRQFGHGRATRSQLMQHPPADRVGNRCVHGVKLSTRIFNHLVEHNT